MTCRLQLTRTYADKVFHFKIFRIKILLKERGITAEPLCEHQFLINLLLSFQDHVAVNGLWKVVGTENVLWLEAVEVFSQLHGHSILLELINSLPVTLCHPHNKWEKEKEENHNLIGYVFRPCKPEVVLHDDKNHEKPDKD
ncbi:hypothetical protein JHK85_048329 [Glycine max]|nr:hypothetical protein JHK85_048329 [Glycine max]